MKNSINDFTAKEILVEIFNTNKNALDIVSEKCTFKFLMVIILAGFIEMILLENPEPVKQYQDEKKLSSLLQWVRYPGKQKANYILRCASIIIRKIKSAIKIRSNYAIYYPGNLYQIAKYTDQEVGIQGWVYNRPETGKLVFLLVRDGSGFIQCASFQGDS